MVQRPRTTKSLTRIVRAAALVWAATLSATAVAQDICVICSEPSAVYRCQLEAGAKAAPQNQLHCMQQLAKEGAHASCAVRRSLSGAACDGTLRIVAAPAQSAPAIGETIAPKAPNPSSTPASAPNAEPPATVAEAARRAKAGTDAQFKQAQDQLRTSTEKTGGALKRSWDCIASFFKRCGSE
jgi:hypothetical protein